MLKAILIIAMVCSLGTAHAEDLTPWFGGEASPPTQIDVNHAVDVKLVSVKNLDCTIYDCASLAKIAKPDQKNASNP